MCAFRLTFLCILHAANESCGHDILNEIYFNLKLKFKIACEI